MNVKLSQEDYLNYVRTVLNTQNSCRQPSLTLESVPNIEQVRVRSETGVVQEGSGGEIVLVSYICSKVPAALMRSFSENQNLQFQSESAKWSRLTSRGNRFIPRKFASLVVISQSGPKLKAGLD
jgi:hypothetical protein